MKLNFNRPGGLGQSPGVSNYQIQTQANLQPSVVLIGSTLPAMKKGDLGMTVGETVCTLFVGSAGAPYRIILPRGYKAIQSGTTDPTVAANFPNDGDTGWYNRTSTTEAWLCYNIGGTLWGIAASTSF